MNEGFFTFPKILPPKGNLQQEIFNKPGEPHCNECGLDKVCKWPQMKWTGLGRKGILIIGEAPGATEDTTGEQFTGDVGQFFNDKLKSRGIILSRDCYKINAINCRPPDNRNPYKKELQCCKPWILKCIEEVKPKHIWLMGSVAVESFYLVEDLGKTNITRWRGFHIPDQDFKCWIHPLYHPSFPYRDEKNRNLMSTYDRDLDAALSYLDVPFPTRQNDEDNVVILYDYKDVIAYLDFLIEEKWPITYDYETTGIKPFKKGHRIYCAGIDDGKGAVVFPLQRPGAWTDHELKVIESKWTFILEDPDIEKTCHHIGFEMLWGRVRLGCTPVNHKWCTMVNSHIIDDRKDICGLKFQTYINFGIKGYDYEIAPYLEGDEFNSIDEAPQNKLHKYCGLDCIFTRDLRKLQEKVISQAPDLQNASEFFNEAIHTFTNMQIRGFGSDESYIEKEWKRLSERMDKINERLLASPEAERFRKETGKQLKLTSNKDLQHLFYKTLGYQSVKSTAKGGESTDVEVLRTINTPFTQRLLSVKKIKKVRDTYLAQFKRETTEGRIHTFYNLHIARSFRSSSSDPNLHNIPVRDEMAKRSCRTALIPSEDHRLIESDYDAMEVKIAGCYTEDPVWVDYCSDPSKDMHRDESCALFLLSEPQVTDKIRFFGKNQWVFPELYGSYYVSCASNLWQDVVLAGLKTEDGVEVREWLATKGIETYSQFENHCKKHEKEYWHKYRGVKKWQEKVLKKYLEKGYVETFFGHRRHGYLTPNIIINTPIQGTAFHCLLWSCNRVDRISLDERWNSLLIGQVHDSMTNDTYPPEQEMVVETVKQVAEEDIRAEFSWIIVPLTMEFEFTPINGNWYLKEKVTQNENGDFVDKKGQIYDLNY